MPWTGKPPAAAALLPKGGRSGPPYKRAIVALVERGGKVRSFHVAVADRENVAKIVGENVAREATPHTDESKLYTRIGTEFAAHGTVKHSAKEYVRGIVHTNTVEGLFSIFKRGMQGIYQHCREKHLHRYLAEYDFRCNHRVKLGFDDRARMTAMVRGVTGKRLATNNLVRLTTAISGRGCCAGSGRPGRGRFSGLPRPSLSTRL